MFSMIWHGDSRRQGAGCPQHPAGTLRGLCEGCASPPERGGRLQLVPGLPLNATPSRPRLSHALDRLRGRRPGQSRPSKNALGAGYTRKPVSAPASSTAQALAMPSLLGQQNAVPWKRLRNRRSGRQSGRQGGHPQPSRGPRRAPLPCPVMLLCLAWARSGRRSAPFAGSPASSLPLPVPRGQHSGHTCPHPRCCLQLPVPPEDSVPGSPAGGEREAAGDTWERAAGWPGLPAQCLQPRPRQGSPARARPGPASGASLLPWFQAFLGAENRNQPCVFQAARLLRNSCLSLGTETAFCPPLAPFRERDTCCLGLAS